MTDVTLHTTPSWRIVVVEQIRIVSHSLRREALAIAAFLCAVTIIFLVEVVRGGPGFDSRQPFPTFLIALLFPFAVWRGQRRFGAAFLWTLPVDRRRLALARVFAGGLWLATALVIFVSWIGALSLIAHVPPARNLVRVPVVATIAWYLFSSALVVGVRHPVRWLLGAAGVLFMMGVLSELFGSGTSDFDTFLNSIGFTAATYRAAASWYALPFLLRWTVTTFISIGAGVFALLVAASRHKETR